MFKKITIAVLFLMVLSCACNLYAQNTQNAPAPVAPIWTIDFGTDTMSPGVYASKNFCWDIDDHLVLFSTDSSMQISFHLPPGDYSKCKLRITDRASALDIQRGIFAMSAVNPAEDIYYMLMVNVDVNDKDAIYNNNVYWDYDMTHTYDLRGFVKDDANTISVTLDPRSQVRYEIQKIELLMQ